MQLPFDFWENEKQWLVPLFEPRFQALAAEGVTQAERKLSKLGIYFDNSQSHAFAAHWAKQHTAEILSNFEANTAKMVGDKVASWTVTEGATMGDLVKLLTPILDDNVSRADAVAVTETTRCVAEGNNIAYKAAGIPGMAYKPPSHPRCRCDSAVRRLPGGVYVVVWLTERDSLTCIRPITTPWGEVAGCRALQGVIISEGEYLGKKYSEVAA